MKFERNIKGFKRDVQGIPLYVGLYQYTEEELSKMKVLYNEKGIGGAIKDNGHITSVFNISEIRGAGRELMKEIIKEGGRKLICFEELKDYYRELGFQETDTWTIGERPGKPEYWDTSDPKYGVRKVIQMELI